MTMGDEPTTTLTVAKLKALCVLNDVSASGKKAESVSYTHLTLPTKCWV